MEEKLAIEITVLGLYIVLGTVVALLARRYGVRTSRDYYIAGGRLGTFLGAMTYAATTYSSFMIVGLVGIAYFTGIGSLGFELAYYVSTLGILAAISHRIYRKAREREWVTPSEMLGDIYGSRLFAAFVSLVYFFALLPYASAQLKGIGETVAGLGGSPHYLTGIILGIILVLVWTLLAGVWSVAVTDALQGAWMITAALLLLGWVYWKLSTGLGVGLHDITHELESKGLLDVAPNKGFWKLPVFISFTLPWLFFALTNPQVVQRLYMPRNEKSLKGMIVWFGVFGLVYTLVVVAIGLLARAGEGFIIQGELHGKDSVTPALLNAAPLWLSVIVFVSIIAASISTVDSIVLSVASSIGHDLLYSRNEQRELLATKAAIVLMVSIAGFIAYERISYIVELSVLSSVLLLPLLPPTLVGILSERPEKYNLESWTAVILGLTVALFSAWHSGVSNVFTTNMLGLPVPAWVFSASWLPFIVRGIAGLRRLRL